MRIRIGTGTNGDIYEDLEKVKACNLCKHFLGFGLHACAGHCFLLNKDISGGYTGNYHKVANECKNFEAQEWLLEENKGIY